MNDALRQPTWPQALAELAQAQELPWPGFQTTGMGTARTLPGQSDRFVTLKRRLVSLAEAEREGIEFTLWQDQADSLGPVVAFRESIRPAAGEIARAFKILRGWLIDEVSVEAVHVMTHHHPLVQAVALAGPSKLANHEYWLADGDQFGIKVQANGWEIYSRGQRLTSWRAKESGQPHPALDLESLDHFCSWIAAQWSVVAFGGDSRPVALREGAVAASRAYANAELARATERDGAIRVWWSKHAVRAADPELPNLFLERQSDNLIISWDASPTPDRLYQVQSGEVVCSVVIAVPVLRRLLADRRQGHEVSRSNPATWFDVPPSNAQAGYLAMCQYDNQIDQPWLLRHGFGEQDAQGFAVSGATRHPIGGLLRSSQGSSLTRSDYDAIFRFLMPNQPESYLKLRELAQGVNSAINSREPWESGYHLATVIRARLGVSPTGYVDIEQVVEALSILVKNVPLQDNTILGACVGAPGYAPLILINPSCPDASGMSGRRITLAHELCHLLFDRAGFRSLARFEGGSADGDRLIEMRANAFAVELLVPMETLIGPDGQVVDDSALKQISSEQAISLRAVVQHAANLRSRLLGR